MCKKKEKNMKFGEYLSRNKIDVHQCAKDLHLSVSTVRGVLYETGYVSATIAKKIYEYTQHQVSIQDIILKQAGWERCPCCSQTLSDYDKIDQVALEAAKAAKKTKKEIVA